MFSCSLGEKARVSTGFSQYFLNLGGGGGAERNRPYSKFYHSTDSAQLLLRNTHIYFFSAFTLPLLENRIKYQKMVASKPGLWSSFLSPPIIHGYLYGPLERENTITISICEQCNYAHSQLTRST